MVSRTTALFSLASTLIVAACSSSESTPVQPGSGSGASTGGSAGALPSGAAGESGGALQLGGSGGSTTAAGNGGSGGSSASTGSGGGFVGGAASGGMRTEAGAGAAIGGSAQGGMSERGGTSPQAGTSARGGSAGDAGGASPSGGTSAGAPAAGGVSSGPFVLAWQDDFDSIDSSAWQLQTFTWEGNQAQFSTQNASASNGVLTISLTTAPSGSEKPYLGVEMRSARTLTYGKVSARMRFAKGSAVVSGLVLFYTPFPNCDWNEIDIEHLGKSSTSSQLNAMVYAGTPNPGCTTSVTPTQDPYVADLGFDAEADFHVYDVEWTPSGVKYFADAKLLRTWTARIDLLKLPANILLTIWASSAADWAGALTSTSAPTSAQVDWIKVYDYDASSASAP